MEEPLAMRESERELFNRTCSLAGIPTGAKAKAAAEERDREAERR